MLVNNDSVSYEEFGMGYDDTEVEIDRALESGFEGEVPELEAPHVEQGHHQRP
jgi:hypothetical protein